MRSRGSSAESRLYTKDGATWFRATEFGDEKDRVVVRENGQKTYFASDIAYHLEKRERGFQRLIDVLGADHHGYIARVRAGLTAMGEPGDCLEVNLIQFVSLFRGGEKVPMGKREGQFVTLRQLREEVGNDACRLFYLMRSHEQPLDFDLELAKSRSNENPVYYIQYAHARVASVMKQLGARGLSFDLAAGLAGASLLTGTQEQAVLGSLVRYPEVLEQAALNRAPHAIVHYLRDLANTFHTYYNAEQFIVGDPGTAMRVWRWCSGSSRSSATASVCSAFPRRRRCRPASMPRLTTRDYKRSSRNSGAAKLKEFGLGVLVGAVLASAAFLIAGAHAHHRAAASSQAGAGRGQAEQGAPRAGAGRYFSDDPDPASPSGSAPTSKSASASASAQPQHYDFYRMLPNFKVPVSHDDQHPTQAGPAPADARAAARDRLRSLLCVADRLVSQHC